MKLVACPSCACPAKDSDAACPHCGGRLKEAGWSPGAAAILMGALAVAACGDDTGEGGFAPPYGVPSTGGFDVGGQSEGGGGEAQGGAGGVGGGFGGSGGTGGTGGVGGD